MMKRKSLFKLIVGLPALVLALSACSDKPEPRIDAGILGFAVQIEDVTNHGSFTYMPDIRAAVGSTSDVTGSRLEKNNSFYPYFISPDRFVYETTMLPASAQNTLVALNGKYTFSAVNEEMKNVSVWLNWNFTNDHQFNEGWGENPDEGSRQQATHYSEFSYDGTRVKARVNSFDEDMSVQYYILYGYEYFNGTNRYISRMLANRTGDMEIVKIDPGTETSFNLGLYLPKGNFDKAKVALAAVKEISPNMNVMLRTEYKTIDKDMNWFVEDGMPVENPVP